MDIQQALSKVAERQDLTTEEMQAVMTQVMTGEATKRTDWCFLNGVANERRNH